MQNALSALRAEREGTRRAATGRVRWVPASALKSPTSPQPSPPRRGGEGVSWRLTMKFGVFLMPQHPRSDDSVMRFRETVELARLARDAGFDAVAAGHHYLSPPYQSLQSVPLLSRLAADTGGMDLCLSVLLLALLNPLQVAEDIASLHVV